MGNVAGTFNPINATQAQTLKFNMGDDIASGGTGLAGTTQFAAQDRATSDTPDG